MDLFPSFAAMTADNIDLARSTDMNIGSSKAAHQASDRYKPRPKAIR